MASKRGKTSASSPTSKESPAERARREGWLIACSDPLVSRLAATYVVAEQVPGFANVGPNGTVLVSKRASLDAQEWAWVYAHLLLHLGLGHTELPPAAHKRRPSELVAWTAACDVIVDQMLQSFRIGRAPLAVGDPSGFGKQSEHALFQRFLRDGVPAAALCLGVAGDGVPDLRFDEHERSWGTPYSERFAQGIRDAVRRAVDAAGGLDPNATQPPKTVGERARGWFLSSYPLLGGLAAAFRIVEERAVCQRLDIHTAAISEDAREIYLNPLADLDEDEARFVIAHELLHAGLRHSARRKGREPFLWNVACDFVINAWLVEMKVGKPPSTGVLYDPELGKESAEAIYDRIAHEMRKLRRLRTLAGTGAKDILDGERGRFGEGHDDLDAFCRRAIAEGLRFHQQQGRGFLPGELVEDIYAQSQPPLSWDVELARLFDAWFPPLERRRSYARLSRRQSSTPDIPRPGVVPADVREAYTFGVVLDSSSSMLRPLLAKGLGAIATTALAKDVPLVRMVVCDARPYDEGYVAPERLLTHAFGVKGRGGTVLQPALDLLHAADDFPKDGPILVVTDGMCDVLHVGRPHAFVLPRGGVLPFPAKGPVFVVD